VVCEGVGLAEAEEEEFVDVWMSLPAEDRKKQCECRVTNKSSLFLQLYCANPLFTYYLTSLYLPTMK